MFDVGRSMFDVQLSLDLVSSVIYVHYLDIQPLFDIF